MKLHETLNVLLRHLESTGRTMNLKNDHHYLENVKLKGHAYLDEIPNSLSFDLGHVWDKLHEDKGRYLELATQEGHNVWIDLKDVDKIAFDAIVSSPKTGPEMEDCLRHLESLEPYHVYLQKKAGEQLSSGMKLDKEIFNFYKIKAQRR